MDSLTVEIAAARRELSRLEADDSWHPQGSPWWGQVEDARCLIRDLEEQRRDG